MAKEIVAEMVDIWLSERPTRSIASLSKLTGVGESTLRRAQLGTTKPSLDTIIVIGRATGKNDLMLKAVEKYYPGCLGALAKTKMAEGQPVESDTSEFFEDGFGTAQFIRLFARKNLTKSYLFDNYGKMGIEIAERFVSLKIATEDVAGNLVPTEKWYSFRSPSELLQTIRILNVSFDKTQLGSNFARINLLSESVNEKAACLIQAIVDDSIIAIRRVMDDPNSNGDHVLAVSTVMQAIK